MTIAGSHRLSLQLLALCVLAPRTASFLPSRSLHPKRGRCDKQYETSPPNTPKEADPDSQAREPTTFRKEERLSDIDSRVLQSMLQDGTLDLNTEEDMKKLLARGIGPKDAPTFDSDETDNEFSSRIVTALTDTKLWRALAARADEFVESASIYVANRVERDTKLLASIGIFAWERAKRDVARALPATSEAAKVVREAAFQLGNSSSVSEAIKTAKEKNRESRSLNDINLYEELNTPLDEIRSVTQSIRDILKGEKIESSTSRGLRSAAPAGEKTRTERQQRAYLKRKQSVLKREKEGVNVRRVAGTIADAAWEVKRDMEVESNRPGFKTERVRNVIAAGAKTTSRVIAAARDGEPGAWRRILFGPKDEEKVLKLGSAQAESIEESLETLESLQIEIDNVPDVPDVPELPELPDIPPEPTLTYPDVPLPVELVDEQGSVVSRLRLCIEKPEETWLTTDVLRNVSPIDPDSLTDVVTAMIIARDDLDAGDQEVETVSQLVKKLRIVKSNVDMAYTLAETAAGVEVARKLRDFLYGSDPADEIQPTLLALNDIQAAYEKDVMESRAAAEAAYEDAVVERALMIDEWEIIFEERERIVQDAKRRAEELTALEARLDAEKAAARAASEAAAAKEGEAKAKRDRIADAVIVDTLPLDVTFTRAASSDVQVVSSSEKAVEVIVDDDDLQSTFAELVTDADFEDDDARFKTVSEISDDDEEKERDVATEVVLRSLDVVFSLLEKTLMVLPGVFQLLGTASKRIEEASRGGLGRIGWSRIQNTQKGSKRY